MGHQHAHNAPDAQNVPNDEQARSGATSQPRAGWAGDKAPDPDNDDPNPVYAI